MRRIELLTPCVQGRCSPSWATPPFFQGSYRFRQLFFFESSLEPSKLNNVYFSQAFSVHRNVFYLFRFLYFSVQSDRSWVYFYHSVTRYSIERRWSSRTFRYGYLVTTSPQSSTPPSTTSSLLLDYRLRVLPTLMVWRAVCTRPGNVFTAACWSAITSNSGFM